MRTAPTLFGTTLRRIGSAGVLVLGASICLSCAEAPPEEAEESRTPAPEEPTEPEQDGSDREAGTGGEASAAAAPFESEEELNRWLAFYYTNPEPRRVVPAIRALSEFGDLSSRPDQRDLAYFFAEVFRANPDRLSAWVEALAGLPPEDRMTIAGALRLADTPESLDALRALAETAEGDWREAMLSLEEQPAMRIRDMPITTIGVIDVCVAAFSASGDEQLIVRIAQLLPDSVAQEDPKRVGLAAYAQATLTEMCVEHERVLETCLALADDSTGALRDMLYNVADTASARIQLREEGRQDGSAGDQPEG